MKTTINFEQTTNDYGERCLRFIGAQNVEPLEMLPFKYRESDVTMDIDEEGILYVNTSDENYKLVPGRLYSVDQIKTVQKAVKKAGKRLDKVRKEIRALDKNWCGRNLQLVV